MEAHWPGWLRTVTRINYDVITSLAITIGGQNDRQIGSPRSPRVGEKDRGKCEPNVRAKERERESSGKDEGQENNESRNTVHTEGPRRRRKFWRKKANRKRERDSRRGREKERTRVARVDLM